MGWGIGIGIGWPNTTSGNTPATVYEFIAQNCGGNEITIYSISSTIQEGVRIFLDSNLSTPVPSNYIGEPFNVQPNPAYPGFYNDNSGLIFNSIETCE